ncbi:MAG: class I SAM-dependent methyltransferase [Microbacterium sp.]
MTPAEAFDALAPRLRRRPDVEAHDLVAADASDRLLLASSGLDDAPGSEVTVIGDRHGALALSLARAGETVRVHQDALAGERAARRNAVDAGMAEDAADPDAVVVPEITWHGLDASLASGATLVLLQLPRALDALDEIAGLVAAHADPRVELVAVGRVKHMSLAMNDVLAGHFRLVSADRGVGRSRILRASEPVGARGAPWPRRERDAATGLTVCAHGAAFAGARVDIGTRLLLSALPDAPEAPLAIDLGCGSGVLAAAYARAHPRARVLATDQSWAAVASATATAEANGVARREPDGAGVGVVRDDGLGGCADETADLILLNPPFHSGAAVTTRIGPRLFADAARVLRPGGELWCVWNSHLRYRPELERIVGPTRQVARDAKFTVTASTRPETAARRPGTIGSSHRPKEAP